MRLAFNDIKKTISRRSGEPRLIPYLLPIPHAPAHKSAKTALSTPTTASPLPSVRASGGRPNAGRASTARPARELDALIALYEAYVGRPRSAWPEDRAALLIGDYRLARCLETVLADWYVWQSPAWPVTGSEAAALAAREIATPSQLRLALYDFVSASYGGFLPTNDRDAALNDFASELAIPRTTIESLLYLDSDARAVLTRLSSEAPTAAHLATRYNQRVLEAVLTNSSHVEWLLTPEYVAATGEPLGGLVKRICFLARRMGVQYDVAYADIDADTTRDTAFGSPSLPLVAERRAPYRAGQEFESSRSTESHEGIAAESATASALGNPKYAAESATDTLTDAITESQIPAESATAPIGLAAGLRPANERSHTPSSSSVTSVGESSSPSWPFVSFVNSVVNSSSPLAITLYGPQEMTGAPNQYGERLARLCRALLGYRRAAEKPGRSTLAGLGLTGNARVYLHGRPYTFELDSRLLKLIGSADSDGGPDDGDTSDSSTPQFDSALEQRLYEQFAALERDGEARGWRMEREPEPLLAGTTILVPDFALTRGAQRVYLEIAGYWRPEYRERKARKLAAVRGRVALALAAPLAARAELAPLERDFPILWYKDFVSAESLLALLDRAYNDLDARLARLDPAAIHAEVDARGCIPPLEGMALLRCYSRAELACALDLLQLHTAHSGLPAPEWLDGIGLCSPAWLAHLLNGIRHALEAADGQRLPLAEVSAVVASLLDGHRVRTRTLPESAIETLARRADLHIRRTSIFDAEVVLEDVPPSAAPTGGEDPAPPKAPTTQPRRRVRRTHTRTQTYITQSIFPPEQPGPDHPEPDIPTRAP